MSEAIGIVLPTQKIAATSVSPDMLIIFSKPKVGKTTLFAELPNWLILDLENGSKFVNALKMQANSVQELKAIGEEIKKAGKPYDGIIIDTGTALEEMCIPFAETLYARTSMGKNWFKTDAQGNYTADSGKKVYGNIINLPNGGGYQYLREAFSKMIEYIRTLAPKMILSCHVKDVVLEKAGAEFNSLDLDLTGKIKRITSAQSDAIGYLYRKGNQNILSFKTTDEVACGARPDHLRNAEIVISEMVDNQVITHWDRVFIDKITK
jgi:hypothetical protein